MLEPKTFINDNYLDNLLIDSNFEAQKSRRKKKNKTIIINKESEFLKFSTFNKIENSSRVINSQEIIKSIPSLKTSSMKKKKIYKKKRNSANISEKNIKFVNKLANKKNNGEYFCSYYDTNKIQNKDDYYNEQSLSLIQKKLEMKIKALKNDNKFLESVIINNFDGFELFSEKGIKQENDKERENDEKNKIKKNQHFSTTIKSKSDKILEKLNFNQSLAISDESPFIKDMNNNYEDIKTTNNDDQININIKNINKEKKLRNLEKKKLVYDSFDDDEIIEEEFLKDEIIYISLESKFILIFDYIVLLLCLYSLIFIPLYVSSSVKFKYYHFENIINSFMDLIYIIDFILSFFRPYYNFEEQLIYKNSKIIFHYLYNFFLVDLICSIPFYSIFGVLERNKNYNKFFLINLSIKLDNLYRMFEFLKLLKLFKIVDKKRNLAINNIVKFLEEYTIFENYEFIFEVFLSISVIHITTCLNIFISRNSFPNWIIVNNLVESSFISIYFTSFYFIITTFTTVGYGDITGKTIKEIIFKIFLLIFGIMSYSWIISNLSNMISEKNNLTKIFNDKVRILDEIRLKYSEMNDEIYNKIYRYLEYTHLNYKKNSKLIIDSLPYTLKNTLLNEMYKPLINNFNFFKNFKNSSFVLEIVRKLYPIRAYKNEILLDQGDLIENMIFIKEGRLNLEVKIDIDNPIKSVNKLLNDDIILGIKSMTKKNYDALYQNLTTKESFNKNNSKFENKYNSSPKVNKERKINFLHLKILEIRKSEHFGGLLIFLDRRSPLTLRVKTKKADLYFLKKLDVVEISSNYSNIWKRINRISFHNLKQISKYMKKIIKQYCDTYGIKYQTKSNQKLNNNIKNNKISFNLDKNEDKSKKKKFNKKIKDDIKMPKSILKNSNKKSNIINNKMNNNNEKNINIVKNLINFYEKNDKNKFENNINNNTLNEDKKSNNDNGFEKNKTINNNLNNSILSYNDINKKKSKFYQIQPNNDINLMENQNLNVIQKNFGLTPYSTEEVNDEIYLGEKFIINPPNFNELNVNQKTTIKSNVISSSLGDNKILAMNTNSFSILNLKPNNKNNLKVTKNINLEFLSKYDNLNKISKYKYALDKIFQKNIKNIIKEKYSKNKKENIDLEKKNSINNKFLSSSDILSNLNKKMIKKRTSNIDTENPYKYFLFKNNNIKSEDEIYIKESNKSNIMLNRIKFDKDNSILQKQNSKYKKRKYNFLNRVSKNIIDNSIVLTNPNKFYSGFFSNIINDIDKNNSKKKIIKLKSIQTTKRNSINLRSINKSEI